MTRVPASACFLVGRGRGQLRGGSSADVRAGDKASPLHLASALPHAPRPGRPRSTEGRDDGRPGPGAWGRERAWEPWTVRAGGGGASESSLCTLTLWMGDWGPETSATPQFELDSAPASLTAPLELSLLSLLHSGGAAGEDGQGQWAGATQQWPRVPWPASTAAWSRAGPQPLARGVCPHQLLWVPTRSERQELAPGGSDPVPAVCQAPSRHLLLSQPLGQGGEQGAPGAQVQSVCRARTPDSGQDRARQDSPHPPSGLTRRVWNEHQNLPPFRPLVTEAGSPQSCLPYPERPSPTPACGQARGEASAFPGSGRPCCPALRGGSLHVEFSMTLQRLSSGRRHGFAGPCARAAAN